MFKLTSYRSYTRLFPDIKLHNRLSVIVCDGVSFLPLSNCPDTVGYETGDRSVLLADVFQCTPGCFPVLQELLFMAGRGLLLDRPTDFEKRNFETIC